MKIVIITESYDGVFEYRDEKYSSIYIFNQEKLDALSKKTFESNFLEQILEEDDSYEPINGVDYSFEDIEEEMNVGDDYKSVTNQRNGDLTIWRMDLETATQEDIERLFLEIKEYKSSSDGGTSFCFENLEKIFDRKELSESIITDDINIKRTYQISVL